MPSSEVRSSATPHSPRCQVSCAVERLQAGPQAACAASTSSLSAIEWPNRGYRDRDIQPEAAQNRLHGAGRSSTRRTAWSVPALPPGRPDRRVATPARPAPATVGGAARGSPTAMPGPAGGPRPVPTGTPPPRPPATRHRPAAAMGTPAPNIRTATEFSASAAASACSGRSWASTSGAASSTGARTARLADVAGHLAQGVLDALGEQVLDLDAPAGGPPAVADAAQHGDHHVLPGDQHAAPVQAAGQQPGAGLRRRAPWLPAPAREPRVTRRAAAPPGHRRRGGGAVGGRRRSPARAHGSRPRRCAAGWSSAAWAASAAETPSSINRRISVNRDTSAAL